MDLPLRPRQSGATWRRDAISAPRRCGMRRRLAVRPACLVRNSGFPLSPKAAVPFRRSSAAKVQVELSAMQVNSLGRTSRVCLVQGLLGDPHEGARGPGLLFRDLRGRSQVAGGGNGAADEAPAASALRRRPVRIMAIASALPAPRRPLRANRAGNDAVPVSGSQKRAHPAEMMMSHIIASSKPPLTACPVAAATVALRQRAMRSHVAVLNSSSNRSMKPLSRISLMSALAAKALSEPVMTRMQMQP